MAAITASPEHESRSAAIRRRRAINKVILRVLFWILVISILVYTIFPFYWAALASVRSNAETAAFPTKYWPEKLTWEHWEYVFDNDNFLKALRNSIIVSFSTVVVALVIGSFAAYAIGRMRFRGRTPITYTILAMTMFPAIAILGSLWQMIRFFHLYNTMQALVATYLTFTLPFTVWVLANFFRAMPRELEESALVDGSTPFQAFYKILLPLALPGLVTTGLLAFIAAWNEFLFALTFTSASNYDARTVQPAIASFSGNTQYDEPWGSIMAASVLVTVPLVALVLIFQRKILGGLTAGAVKG